jgi:ATP-dependent DNA ligase
LRSGDRLRSSLRLPHAAPNGLHPTLHPTRAFKVPAGPDWIHEVKHDGYRLQVRREGDAVRLFTRRGHDWTTRYPAIASTAVELSARSFTLDGEAVVCGPEQASLNKKDGTSFIVELRSPVGDNDPTECVDQRH